MPTEAFHTADSQIKTGSLSRIEPLVDKSDFENFKSISGGTGSGAASTALERQQILPSVSIDSTADSDCPPNRLKETTQRRGEDVPSKIIKTEPQRYDERKRPDERVPPNPNRLDVELRAPMKPARLDEDLTVLHKKRHDPNQDLRVSDPNGDEGFRKRQPNKIDQWPAPEREKNGENKLDKKLPPSTDKNETPGTDTDSKPRRDGGWEESTRPTRDGDLKRHIRFKGRSSN